LCDARNLGQVLEEAEPTRLRAVRPPRREIHLAQQSAPRYGRWLKIVGRSAGAGILLAASVLAQQDVGVIYGRVTDSRGHAQRLMVRLLAAGDIPAGEVYTDAEGQYAFESLPSGEYKLVVEAEGFEPVRQSVRLDTRVSAKMQVYVTLEAITKTGAEPSQVISGSDASHKVDAKKPAPGFDAKALREFDRGASLERKSDLSGALAHYQKALRIEPDFYPALNNLGAIFERQGDHARAEQALLKAIQLNPEDGEAYVNLGHVLFEEGRYPEAAARLHDALKRSPNSAAGHFFLGSTYMKLGSVDQAESNLKEACRLDSKGMPAAHLQLANLYLHAKNFASAESELESYLRANPADPQAPAIRKMLADIRAIHN